ncbi:MAG: hypothetical protein ACTSPB_21015, partial [Candidatus Thorarchaeota archaeon]
QYQAATTVVNYNNFGTDYGIKNDDTSATLDGECNYWGDATGPYNADGNHGQGDNVSDNVDYCPWLDAPYPGGNAVSGIQNINTSEYFCTIQDAIDDPGTLDGHTIIVSDGIYNENIAVNKAITLMGEHSPFGGTSIINGTIDVTADGATIKWLKVEPGNVTGNEAGIAVYASDVTIEENVICNMTGDGSGSIKGIHVYSDGSGIENITILNNYIFNTTNTNSSSSYGGADGIMIQGVVSNVTINGSTIEDIHSAGWANGIEITPSGSSPDESPKNVVITENNIMKINDDSVYDVFADPASAPYPGSCVSVDAYGTTPANASEVIVNYNNFLNLPVFGVINKDSSHILNAALNYWSNPTGPNTSAQPSCPWGTFEDNNTYGHGTHVCGNISFNPWLDSIHPDNDYGNEKQSPIQNSYYNDSFAPNTNAFIDAKNEADVVVIINSSSANNITILNYTGNPEGDIPSDITALGKYVDIIVGDESIINWPVEIRLYYTDDNLVNAGLNEEQLIGLYYWNESSLRWELYNDTGVNTTDQDGYSGYLWARAWNQWQLSPKGGGADTTPPSWESISPANESYLAGEITLIFNASSGGGSPLDELEVDVYGPDAGSEGNNWNYGAANGRVDFNLPANNTTIQVAIAMYGTTWSTQYGFINAFYNETTETWVLVFDSTHPFWQDGEWDFLTSLKDVAGNSLGENNYAAYPGEQVYFTYYIDNTPPETTKSFGTPTYGPDNVWVNLSTAITLSATDPKDNASGVNATYYRIWYDRGWHPNAIDDSYGGNNNIANYNGTLYYVYHNETVDFGPIYFTEECVHYIEFFSVDNASNEENHTIQAHYVDNTPPEV